MQRTEWQIFSFAAHYILRKNRMLFKHDYKHFETKCFIEITNMHLIWENIWK